MQRIFFIGLASLVLTLQVSWSDIPQTISYQGILTDSSGSPVSDGFYELTFRVYESETGPSEWSETHSSVEVKGGVFSVILGTGNPLDLPFDQQCWLGVQIGSEPELSPRIPLTAVPYSLNARLVADGSVTSSKIPTGQVVKSINSLKDDVNLAEGDNVSIEKSGNTLTISAASGSDDAWKLAGNAGTELHNFLGTTDDKPLEIKVYHLRVFRLEPNTNSPNIIGGGGANYAFPGVYGATICGGGRTTFPNRVTDLYGIVGGGYGNQAGNGDGDSNNSLCATASGGQSNVASGPYSTVAGGRENVASSSSASIGGGWENEASGTYSTIGGGEGNRVSGHYATIAGGGKSDSGDDNSGNRVTDDYGTVGGGGNNQAGDAAGAVGDATYATVAGGYGNTASAWSATVGGGYGNTASVEFATIAGGGRSIFSDPSTGNRVTDIYGTVGGGANNEAGNGNTDKYDGKSSTVSGGVNNNAYGVYSTVGGGHKNGAADYATVGGGEGNEAEGSFSTIAGGGRSVPTNPATRNRVYDDYGTIGGGGDNQAGNDDSNLTTATYATIGGGKSNEASDDYATAGGGMGNKATNDYSTIAGGKGNKTQGWGAYVGGGEDNSTSGSRAAVSGGHLNVASGDFSAVPGGENNTAQGDYSLAAGRRAKANNDGAFVWADSQDYDFASTLPDEFSVRCTGGARFVSSIDTSGNPVTGVKLEPDGTGWSNICDRSVKENFARVDTANVLKSLISVPIETWNAKGQDPSIRHIGPMAQDFYRAFGMGEDNRYICTVDADGVALAAIQGLYELLREKDERIAELESRMRKLEEQIASLQE